MKIIESLVEILKWFIQKHLLATILSFVVGVSVYVSTDIDSEVLLKLGKPLYIVFFSSISFVTIKIFVGLINKCKNIFINKLAKEEKYVKSWKETTETLYKMVDSMSEKEKEMLDLLISNNNCPIEIYEYEQFNGNFFLFYPGSEYVDRTEIMKGNIKMIKYKLTEEMFNTIVKIKEETGRISHFDKEEQ